MLGKVILAGSLLAAVIYLMLPKENCVCGIKVPEFGGMCECGEYNGRAVYMREQELRRIEEEKRKGDDYDTVL